MAGLLGALIVGVILGIVGANVWAATPIRQEPGAVLYRRRDTGQTYRFDGRVWLAGADATGELWLMADTSTHQTEAWPETRVRAEMERVERP